jgi:hypothetical protein
MRTLAQNLLALIVIDFIVRNIEELNVAEEALVKDILLASIGPITALITIFLTNKWSERKFERERRDRFLAETRLIRHKALQDINAIMVKCWLKLNNYANVAPTTLDEFNREISDPLAEFMHACTPSLCGMKNAIMNETKNEVMIYV